MAEASTITVPQAEVRAKEAKAEFMSTLGELRHRLDPRVVAHETAEGISERASKLVHGAGDAVKDRPGVTAGGAVALLGAIGLRFWLKSRARNNMAETHGDTDHFEQSHQAR